MIEAELPDGTILEFPDGTDPSVVQKVVKSTLGVQDQAVAAPVAPTAPEPSFGPLKTAGAVGLEIAGGLAGGALGTLGGPASPVTVPAGAVAGSAAGRQLGIKLGFRPDLTLEQELALITEQGSSTAGMMAGQSIGGRFGAGGRIVGGIAGGIAGSLGAKEGTQEAGLVDKKGLGENIATSVAEEVAGQTLAVAGKVLSDATGVSSALSRVTQTGNEFLEKKLGRKLGYSKEPRSLKDLYLKTDDGRTIVEAQRNISQEAMRSGRVRDLSPERLLTVMEETGGKAGKKQLDKMLRAATTSSQQSEQMSSSIMAQREVQTRISEALAPNGKLPDGDNKIAEAFKGSLKSQRDRYNNAINQIDEQLVKMRPSVMMDVQDIPNALSNAQLVMSDKLGTVKTNKIMSVLEKHLTRPGFVPGQGRLYKDSISLADVQALKGDIKTALGEFSPTKNAQDADLTVYEKTIGDYLDQKYESMAAAARASNAPTQSFFDLQDAFDNLSRAKGDLDRSTIGRLIGTTEGRQEFTNKDMGKLENVIFNTQQTWREAEDFLTMTKNTALLDVMRDRFRQNILSGIKDNATGEISAQGIRSAIDKYGEDLIAEVAGRNYLTTLKDAEAISQALEVTAPARSTSVVPEGPEDQILRNMARTTISPLHGRVGLMQGFLSGIRKYIGAGSVTDEHIYKAMQGERGRLNIERGMNSLLADPSSYAIYVNIVEDLVRAGANLPTLTKEEYIQATQDALFDLNQANDIMMQQEAQQ